MKANEAPEKLYLISDEDGVMLSYDPSTKLQYGNRYDFVDKEVFPIEEGCEVEYTRTDAFIEKATAWLSNVSLEDMTYKYNDFYTSEGWYKFIGDFRKYMSL